MKVRMSQGDWMPMDASKPPSFFLRSTSAVSLNERFSQVLENQLCHSRMRTFDPVLLEQRQVFDAPQVVLLVSRESLSSLQTCDMSVRVKQHLRRRRSVWTRLGWQQVTRRLSTTRPRGFWSFRKKYRWRTRFRSIYRGRRNLHSRLGQRRLLRMRNIQKLTAGRTHLQKGGANTCRWWGRSKAKIPTKKQLDAQLDKYMSMSKSRLDKQLDDYMSMSKSRLDADLDEYMSMAGQTETIWD
ncbi:uncharacterized protein LOC125893933 isoform X1 [Epinephelus fuscoguttatus]|uniref:uncharacterized protein LOC125893933 isoform X1 n=2 Tax=Epinephelus fuscoguttatus TaxID=293821 RepID=UPI0020D13E77|nr:uncharacterized protein LOC125893933 isoform X1 [Epinephelus fuscoguttatus]